jgi:hypothetical protein
MVMSIASMPPPVLAPEFYLARPNAGTSAADAAAVLQQQLPAPAFTVITAQDRVRASQRSLTALNLAGLSTIESAFAALIAALDVTLLGPSWSWSVSASMATVGTGMVLATTGLAFFATLERLRRSNLSGLLRES